MKIDNKFLPKLKGEEFSSSEIIKFTFDSEDDKMYSKISLLTQLCKNKKIIHVGCVDHNIDLIEQKIKKDKWLHKFLVQHASYTIGVDIEEKGLLHIKEKYNYEVAKLDITKPNDILLKKTYDYILFPDVIEHIGNPVDFLTKVRDSYKNNVKQIIITVPNAITKHNIRYAKQDEEQINTDHKFWFTPYTISKVIIDSGYDIERLYMISGVKEKSITKYKNKLFKYPFIRKYILNDRYLMRGTIVVVANLNPKLGLK